MRIVLAAIGLMLMTCATGTGAFERSGFRSSMSFAEATEVAAQMGSSLEPLPLEGEYYQVSGTPLSLTFCDGRLVSLSQTHEPTVDAFASLVFEEQHRRGGDPPELQVLGLPNLSTIDARFEPTANDNGMLIQLGSYSGKIAVTSTLYSGTC